MTFQTKATIVHGAGISAQPHRTPEIVTPSQRRLTIRDLIPVVTTNGNSVEYTREDSFTNSAAPVAEGGIKPESSLVFCLQTAQVRTLAHWIPASKQILDDAPGLAAHIDRRLTYGLKLVEEKQLLAGDGTGQNLLGIIPQAVAYNVALNVAGDTRIDRIRHAIYQLETTDNYPNGIVLNPMDWQAIELVKTTGTASSGQYILEGPLGNGDPRIWRLPIIISNALASGTFLVGDFQNAAVIHNRQEATIEVSNSHSDFFTRNLIAVRGEERIALAVHRPAGFVTGSFA